MTSWRQERTEAEVAGGQQEEQMGGGTSLLPKRPLDNNSAHTARETDEVSRSFFWILSERVSYSDSSFLEVGILFGKLPWQMEENCAMWCSQKSNHQKDSRAGWGNGAAFQNLWRCVPEYFLNGKYWVHNSKLLPMEEQSNIREAYFDKAELAWTVLPLLWESDKIYHVVWLDSGDNWIFHGHYGLTNPVYVDRWVSLTWCWGKKKKKNSWPCKCPKEQKKWCFACRAH